MLEYENIKFLVVHCSDTDDKIELNAKDIHKMHLDFGWDGVGYHKIIRRDGRLDNCRPDFWIGAHVKSINHISLGVCLIGRNNFTTKQMNCLFKVILDWKKLCPNAKVLGHRDVVKTHKTCPNFNVEQWWNKANKEYKNDFSQNSTD